MPYNSFEEFNLDPALAEAVSGVNPDSKIEGILKLDSPEGIPSEFIVVCRFGRIFTGRFKAADAWNIRRRMNVVSLKAARPVGSIDEASLKGGVQRIPKRAVEPYAGRGCVVGQLDFGLDFAHPNFRNADGSTRVLAFWHQGGQYDPLHPNVYGYGRIFSRDEIDKALTAESPYTALEYHPSISDTGSGSHGTHTLDIAAGNGQVGEASAAAEAEIVFVHLSTPNSNSIGNLGDSVRLLEGLDFVSRVAGEKPWVLNLSVGRTAGCKDGTSLVEQGMHECLRMTPGRAIVQSAGNYRSADLTAEGWIQEGETRDLRWLIDPANTTPNELEIWYSGNDRFAIEIQPPYSTDSVQVSLGKVEEVLFDDRVIARVYHRKNDPNNRDNHVDVFLYKGAPSGTWVLRLVGEYVIGGRFHAWIERATESSAQSRFGSTITSERYTLGSIATSPLVITVGAYDATDSSRPPASFSSLGPTRDDRVYKPELLAPGVAIRAARSTPRGETSQQGLLTEKDGSSMAAPVVTGAVAAMFEAAGRELSIHEIRDFFRISADQLEQEEYGGCWGRLNAEEAVRLAARESASASVSESSANVKGTDQVIPANSTVDDARFEGPARRSFNRASKTQPALEATMDDLVVQAEAALSKAYGNRRKSETTFLRELLNALGCRQAGGVTLPAQLFRLAMKDDLDGLGGLLKLVGRPRTRLTETLRPGDWLVRTTVGTGDIGHLAVLVSGNLMNESRLLDENIPSDSALPGYYAVVIEGGAYAHERSEPFARRFLDSSGRLLTHSVILRPVQAQPDNQSTVAIASKLKPLADMIPAASANQDRDGDSSEDTEGGPREKCGFRSVDDTLVSEDRVRETIVEIARKEHKSWLHDGKLFGEGDWEKFSDLVRYWLVGMDSKLDPDIVLRLPEILGSLDFKNLNDKEAAGKLMRAGIPDISLEDRLRYARESRANYKAWSSVFVGSVIRTAACSLRLEADSGEKHFGKDAVLKVSPRHAVYVINARRSEVRHRDEAGKYTAFDPLTRAVQKSDIIVSDRRGHINAAQLHTIDTVKEGDHLHGDIVVDLVRGEDSFAETIGGNVGDSVRRRRYPIDREGMLILSETSLFIQESNDGKFSSNHKKRDQKPSEVALRSTIRVFALLSLEGICGSKVESVAQPDSAKRPTPSNSPKEGLKQRSSSARYRATKHSVLNRGVPPDAFLDELVTWGKTAPEDIFAPGSVIDIYSNIEGVLGPWKGPEHRRAVMLEVMRVLAGFESSWNWNEGKDLDTAHPERPETIEAGAWQVSANSMRFGPELKGLVLAAAGSTNPDAFQIAMKKNHQLAMEYVARLLRRTVNHNGPVKDHKIDRWLRRDSVAEFQLLLRT